MIESKYEIGKYYYPVDNSWSRDLRTGERPTANHGAALAGDYRTTPVKVRIVTEPFEITFKSAWGREITEVFRIVEYNGGIFSILDNFTEDIPLRTAHSSFIILTV